MNKLINKSIQFLDKNYTTFIFTIFLGPLPNLHVIRIYFLMINVKLLLAMFIWTVLNAHILALLTRFSWHLTQTRCTFIIPTFFSPYNPFLSPNLGNLKPTYVSSAQLLAAGFIYQSEITWRQSHLRLYTDSRSWRPNLSITIQSKRLNSNNSPFETQKCSFSIDAFQI